MRGLNKQGQNLTNSLERNQRDENEDGCEKQDGKTRGPPVYPEPFLHNTGVAHSLCPCLREHIAYENRKTRILLLSSHESINAAGLHQCTITFY